MKKCPKCRHFKPPDDFHRNRSSRDGLSDYCKPCQREALRRSRLAHLEERREADRLRRPVGSRRKHAAHPAPAVS